MWRSRVQLLYTTYLEQTPRILQVCSNSQRFLNQGWRPFCLPLSFKPILSFAYFPISAAVLLFCFLMSSYLFLMYFKCNFECLLKPFYARVKHFELSWLNTQCCIVMLARSTRALKSTMAFGGKGRNMCHTSATSGVMDISIQNALSCLSLSYNVSGDITGCGLLD